jgi:hypothetical protein
MPVPPVTINAPVVVELDTVVARTIRLPVRSALPPTKIDLATEAPPARVRAPPFPSAAASVVLLIDSPPAKTSPPTVEDVEATVDANVIA